LTKKKALQSKLCTKEIFERRKEKEFLFSSQWIFSDGENVAESQTKLSTAFDALKPANNRQQGKKVGMQIVDRKQRVSFSTSSDSGPCFGIVRRSIACPHKTSWFPKRMWRVT
jgi:hypothetical protein